MLAAVGQAAKGLVPSMDTVKDAVSGVANSANFGQENTAQGTGTTSAVAPAAEGTAQQLIPATEEANKGLQAGAETEKKIIAPQAAQSTQQTTGAIGQAQTAGTTALQNFQQASDDANKATIAAGQAVQDAAAKSQIDPQRYLNNLGVGGRTLTSIGMLVSGIGSGLTGQPNMAMEVFQKNIDRDIAAQTAEYKNLMEVAAAKKGLLQSAQDRQVIAANALFAAQHSVYTGAQAALGNAMTQAKAVAAPQVVSAAQLLLQQKNQEALDNHSKLYQTLAASKDDKKMNLAGVAATAVSDKTLGTNLSLEKPKPVERVPQPAAPVSRDVGSRSFWDQLNKQRTGKEAPKSFLIKPEDLK